MRPNKLTDLCAVRLLEFDARKGTWDKRKIISEQTEKGNYENVDNQKGYGGEYGGERSGYL